MFKSFAYRFQERNNFPTSSIQIENPYILISLYSFSPALNQLGKNLISQTISL